MPLGRRLVVRHAPLARRWSASVAPLRGRSGPARAALRRRSGATCAEGPALWERHGVTDIRCASSARAGGAWDHAARLGEGGEAGVAVPDEGRQSLDTCARHWALISAPAPAPSAPVQPVPAANGRALRAQQLHLRFQLFCSALFLLQDPSSNPS